ncbi:hypothetical protein [Henriciella aquimarina]|uniref:hypothetical protein n=1 Tax=Henriciella aquimarina TaxID=545261 RepID=UPI000A072C5A|nr:hypothetical protein [Henriciella aquimarina]
MLFRLALTVFAGASALVACSTETAATQPASAPDLGGQCDKMLTYDIDFDRLDTAAQQIAHGTGCFIEIENLESAGSREPTSIKGEMSPRQAITTAIKGTGLSISRHEPDRIVIE